MNQNLIKNKLVQVKIGWVKTGWIMGYRAGQDSIRLNFY